MLSINPARLFPGKALKTYCTTMAIAILLNWNYGLTRTGERNHSGTDGQYAGVLVRTRPMVQRNLLSHPGTNLRGSVLRCTLRRLQSEKMQRTIRAA
jgi:hypothetical protein